MHTALTKMGYEYDLVAEALRQSDNDQPETMMCLTDPSKVAVLLAVVEDQRAARAQQQRHLAYVPTEEDVRAERVIAV